ncbi:M24 family metallopeptidase [Candidatus Formimonas warabiya]|nr:Xaa-Pro peptidase family protein [Candidatus Formimonas warabiya]
MAEKGITKVLVTNPINIFYLTGASIVPYERFMGLVLDGETGKSHLIIPGFEKGHCEEEGTLEIGYQDHEDALAIAADLVQGCEKLGVEKKTLPLFILEQLAALLKQKQPGPGVLCDLVEADYFLEEMRFHKDSGELEKMAKAAGYTVDILDKVKRKLVPGAMEQEIKFELLRQISLEGALMGPASPIQVSSGIHASLAHGIAGPKKIEAGDPVIIDFGVTFEHYRSDITRTFFVGKPQAEFEKMYRVVWEAQQKAIDTVRPGVAIKEVDLAARRHIEKEGYGAYFTTRVGHGLGLEIHEPPSMHQENEQALEEGMVFTIEPGIYIPGLGGVRIEDDVTVNKEGAVVLTDYAKALADVTLG